MWHTAIKFLMEKFVCRRDGMIFHLDKKPLGLDMFCLQSKQGVVTEEADLAIL